jgi:hypothetical protein
VAANDDSFTCGAGSRQSVIQFDRTQPGQLYYVTLTGLNAQGPFGISYSWTCTQSERCRLTCTVETDIIIIRSCPQTARPRPPTRPRRRRRHR